MAKWRIRTWMGARDAYGGRPVEWRDCAFQHRVAWVLQSQDAGYVTPVWMWVNHMGMDTDFQMVWRDKEIPLETLLLLVAACREEQGL